MKWAALLVLIATSLVTVLARAEPIAMPDAEAHNFGFELATPDRAPVGWRAGRAPGGYEVALDPEIKHGGDLSLRIRSPNDSASPAFGVVSQSLAPAAIVGKRIRYSGFIRRADVDDFTGLWLRADAAGDTVAFDNMHERVLRGTADWQRVSVDIDVPSDADTILFGVLLVGHGTVWVDDLNVEILGPSQNPLPAVVATGAAGVVLFGALLFAIYRRRRPRSLPRAIPIAAAATIAIVGVAVAALAPEAWFDLALARLIGASGHADTTVAQRVIAASGALVAAIGLARWGGERPERMPHPGRWRLIVVGVPLGLLLVMNLFFIGAALHLWAFPASRPVGIATAVAALLAVACMPVMSQRSAGAPTTTRRLLFASACGVGYGCFSALWHCCPPLWQPRTSTDFIVHSVWLIALTMTLGVIGRVAASFSAPRGELVGALLFACFYPWHTPVWFAQCLLAGAFSTWMVRLTRSGFAPALFLGCAYVTHMSLPFLGWVGPLLAALLLGAHVIARAPAARGAGVPGVRPSDCR